VKSLLVDLPDHRSRDPDEKNMWWGRLKRLGQADPKAAQRIRGLLDDPILPSLEDGNEGLRGMAVEYVMGKVKDFTIETVPSGTARQDTIVAEHDLLSAAVRLRDFVRLEDEREYALSLLWCAHAKITPILPACYYEGFHGPASSGKTRFMELLLFFVDGQFISDSTEAYLARVMAEGTVLGFDELDEQLRAHKDGMLESLLRQGTSPRATRVILEKQDEEWVPRELRLYGAKVFTTADDPNRALVTRTHLVKMRPHDDVALVLNNLFADKRATSVRKWLAEETAAALEAWDAKRVEELMSTGAFAARLSRIKAGLPRDREIAALMFATAEVFGWTAQLEKVIEDSLQGQVEQRGTEEEALLREVLEGLYEIQRTKMEPPASVWQSDAQKDYNDRLKAIGMHPVSSKAFGTLLRDLGAREGPELRQVRSNHNKREIVFTDELLARLRSSILQSAPSPTSPTQVRFTPYGGTWPAGADVADGADPPMGGAEAQDPDFMAGLGRALDRLRTKLPSDPPLSAHFLARDVEKELKARGHVADFAKVLAGVERGLRGDPA
jgi:hypothetical protein